MSRERFILSLVSIYSRLEMSKEKVVEAEYKSRGRDYYIHISDEEVVKALEELNSIGFRQDEIFEYLLKKGLEAGVEKIAGELAIVCLRKRQKK
jgi:hypothetical protein